MAQCPGDDLMASSFSAVPVSLGVGDSQSGNDVSYPIVRGRVCEPGTENKAQFTVS